MNDSKVAGIIVTAAQLHELRSAVGVIVTAAQVMSENPNMKDREEFMGMIERNGTRAVYILDQIGGVG